MADGLLIRLGASVDPARGSPVSGIGPSSPPPASTSSTS